MEKLKPPDKIKVEVKKPIIVVTGPQVFEIPFDEKCISAVLENGEVVLKIIGKPTKPKTAKLMTIAAHVKNAFKGMSHGFSKKLQVVYSHFPVSLEVKEGNVFIKNFLGEKVPRVAKIVGNVQVTVKGQEIEVSGSDKYAVGQTAENVVRATKVREKDRRVFQDGIYPVISNT